MTAMTRMEARQWLNELSCKREVPEGRFSISDGNTGTLSITICNGDIGIQCINGHSLGGVTFSGSGYFKPLIREALFQLAYAMIEEGADVRTL